MRFKVNPDSTVLAWRTARTWRNKPWTRKLVELIVARYVDGADARHGFTVYDLCASYRKAYRENAIESTVRQILNKLTKAGLLVNIKE